MTIPQVPEQQPEAGVNLNAYFKRVYKIVTDKDFLQKYLNRKETKTQLCPGSVV